MIRFRKEAVNKHHSPERLDDLLRVTTPAHWISLGVIVLIFLSILMWTILGSLTVTVRGAGIIMTEAGISQVKPGFAGKINSILVDEGDHVSQGLILATIDQPEMKLEIQAIEAELDRVTNYYRFLIQNAGNNKAFKKVETLKKLLESASEFSTTAGQMIDSVWMSYSDMRSMVFDLENNRAERSIELGNNIATLGQQLSYKKSRLEIQSKIICPFDGTVVELSMNEGDFFSGQELFCVVENDMKSNKDIFVQVYVDAGEGKRIKPGMDVLVAPTTISPEEYGYMKGYVYYVSRYPSTPQGMNRVVRNEKVVQSLSEKGLPLAVVVKLYTDETTPSGFKWSSGGGPSIPIVSGVLASAQFIIEEKRPYEVFIPYLSHLE